MTDPYYQDEHSTIYHGDCRHLTDLWDIAGAVMVTDPPYGLKHRSGHSAPLFGSVATNYQTVEGDAIQGDNDTTTRDTILNAWLPRPAIVFASPRLPFPYQPTATIVWDKGEASGMGNLTIPWKPNWEFIYVLGTGYVGPRTSAVLRGYIPPRVAMGRRHPNEKPVTLLRQLITKCPPLADIVDPFMGSGSTLRAAKDLGRHSIGIELEERYCELAARRLAQEVLDFGGIA